MMNFYEYKELLRGTLLPEEELERQYKEMIISKLRKYFDLIVGEHTHNIDKYSCSQLGEEELFIRVYFNIQEHTKNGWTNRGY